MKNKIIKNFGVLYSSSNIIFAGKSSPNKDEGKKEEEKKKNNNLDTESTKFLEGVLGNFINTDDTFKNNLLSKLYTSEKKDNKTVYNPNFNVEISAIKDLFKGKLEDNITELILKQDNTILKVQETDDKKKFLIYNGLIDNNVNFIVLKLQSDGTVTNILKCTNEAERKILNDSIFEYSEISGIYKQIVDNTVTVNGKDIYQFLYKNKLGYGIHKLSNNLTDLNLLNMFINNSNEKKIHHSVLIIDNDNKITGSLATVMPTGIEGGIKLDIDSFYVSDGTDDNSLNLTPKSVIVCILQKDKDNKFILVGTAEDISKGKIGNQKIDDEFYCCELEEEYNNFNNNKKNKEDYGSLITYLIDNKIGKGQYKLDDTKFNEIESLMPQKENKKPFKWICFRNGDEHNTTYQLHCLKKNFTFSSEIGKNLQVNGLKGSYVKGDDIIVALRYEEKILLIATGSEVSEGKVNKKPIDKSFYKPTGSEH